MRRGVLADEEEGDGDGEVDLPGLVGVRGVAVGDNEDAYSEEEGAE